MAIVDFTYNYEHDRMMADGGWPEGAYCRIDAKPEDGNKVMVLWTKYAGMCVDKSEVNGYGDSEYYMVVWDEAEQKAEVVYYASTRYWCQPCFGSEVDASPEITQKYRAWKLRSNQLASAMRKRVKLNHTRSLGKTFGVPTKVVRELIEYYGESDATRLMRLRKQNLRSEFKKSLLKQFNDWLDGKGKFKYPLSQKQMQYV